MSDNKKQSAEEMVITDYAIEIANLKLRIAHLTIELGKNKDKDESDKKD